MLRRQALKAALAIGAPPLLGMASVVRSMAFTAWPRASDATGGDFVEHLKDLASEAPVIRLVGHTLGTVQHNLLFGATLIVGVRPLPLQPVAGLAWSRWARPISGMTLSPRRRPPRPCPSHRPHRPAPTPKACAKPWRATSAI